MTTLPYHVWNCPNCLREWRTDRVLPNRYHHCPKLHGMWTPMVPGAMRAKVELVPREDYVGNDIVTRDDRGKVHMAVRTVRDDGTDLAVYAPAVRLSVGTSDLPSLRSLFWARIKQAVSMRRPA